MKTWLCYGYFPPKRRYPDQEEAQWAMRMLIRRGVPIENFYQHGMCGGGWHVSGHAPKARKRRKQQTAKSIPTESR